MGGFEEGKGYSPGYKRKRVSIIGALNEGKVKAPWVIEGHCNSEIFEAYVKYILVPVLKDGQTVVLDNASFHKSERTRNLIESAGCKVLFLPPYSPDLNPIEKFWFAINHAIRKQAFGLTLIRLLILSFSARGNLTLVSYR